MALSSSPYHLRGMTDNAGSPNATIDTVAVTLRGDGGWDMLIDPAKAEGYVRFTANPSDGETCIIDGETWTFTTAEPNAANKSKIGATLAETMTGFVADLNLTAGVAATGTMTLTTQPAAGETITINGVGWIFRASGATGDESNIGAALSDTIDNWDIALNASVTAALATSTYAGDSVDTITVTCDTADVSGNVDTLAVGTAAATVSAATLQGGREDAPAAVKAATYTATADQVNVVHDTTGTAGNSFALAVGTGAASVSGSTLAGGDLGRQERMFIKDSVMSRLFSRLFGLTGVIGSEL